MFRIVIAVLSIVIQDSPRVSPSDHSIGALTSEITSSVNGLPVSYGVAVMSVFPDGPAAKAKIPVASVIVRVNQRLIKTLDDFHAAIEEAKPGNSVTLAGYAPNGAAKTVKWKAASWRCVVSTMKDSMLTAVKKDGDEFTGSITYRHKESPVALNHRTEMYLEYNTKTGYVLTIQRVGPKWLFIETAKAKADDSTHDLPVDRFERKTGYNAAETWEWFRIPVDKQLRDTIKDISSAKKCVLRFSGDKFIEDHELTFDEQNRLLFMLLAEPVLSLNN